MVLLRALVLTAIGFAFVALLAWITNWPYALLRYDALLVGSAAQLIQSSDPLNLPLGLLRWRSTKPASFALTLALASLFGLLLPIVTGIALYRWWWPAPGFVLGGIGAALCLSTIWHVPRLLLGLVVSLAALGWALA